MEIKISNDKSIGEIQKEFGSAFPFLKLEFFKKGMAGQKSMGQVIPRTTMIGQIRYMEVQSNVNIDPDRAVEDVERDFLNLQGLVVQIFRKSGSLWIETSLTVGWSLDRQNREGEQMS